MRSLRVRPCSERGFALTELLVVTMIIGMLAGIALPAFLSQEKKGVDADAKSNARNAVSALESCFVEERDYTSCDTVAELEAAGARLPTPMTDTSAKAEGAIAVDATQSTFTIVGYSESHNAFSITKAPDGTYSRSCTTGGSGGCHAGDVW